MMGLALMRGTLSAIGVLFGSLGMFFLYYSFMEPTLADAMIRRDPQPDHFDRHGFSV